MQHERDDGAVAVSAAGPPQSVRRALAWTYGSQGFTFAVTFVSSVVVARILGPYEMGVFAIAMATAGLLSILSSFGVGPYLMRHEALDRETTSTVFTINALLNVAISAALFLVAAAGARLEVDARVRGVLAVIAVGPLIGIFEFLPSTLLQREMRFRALSLIAMGKVVVTSTTVVAFALAGFGAISPAFAIVATALFGAFATNAVGWRHAGFRVGVTRWREVAAFGVQMMTVGGVAGVAQRLCEIAMGRVLGLAALGVYTRASGLADQVWYNVYGQATRVIFAKMAGEVRATGALDRTFLGGISMIAALFWPFLAGLATLSGPLMHALYGERWLAAAVPFSLLMVAHMIGLAFGMNWELCILTKRTGWQARMELVKALVGSTAFIGGLFFGLVAAALGRVVEALTGFAIYGPQMRRMAGTPPGALAHVFRDAALLTVCAAGPSIAVMLANGWSPRTSWWELASAIALGIALWALTLRRLSHPLADEIVRAVRALASRMPALSPQDTRA